MRKFLKKYKRQIRIVLFGLAIWYWVSLPKNLFQTPTSTVIEDEKGVLLGAKIADDGQWRFPSMDTVPEKFAKSIIAFEDKNFYYHPGVDLLAMARAIKQNIAEGRIVSGGSTLTMQVIRLSRKGKSRTVFEKLKEAILATRATIRYSKREILALYASNAPFGGNVVGLDAAAWRYYGRSAENLSWAESATLAVLPNAPSLIFPGRNQEILRTKRNRLLDKLYHNGELDSLSLYLAKQEPLPGSPKALPSLAPHLLDRVALTQKGERVKTTLQNDLQNKVNGIITQHQKVLEANEIYNAAAIVVEIETGNVLAYVGNTSDPNFGHSNNVDVITSSRSTGSILKPMLYAAAMDEGFILPRTLLPDIPTYYSGYTPQNFDLEFDGAVPASEALSRSLNIPAVRLLKDYGIEQFHHKLKQVGMTTLSQHPDHYGLSLILGGAEAQLWDLAGIYAGMSRSLTHFNTGLTYYEGDYTEPHFIANDEVKEKKELIGSPKYSAGAIWSVYEALLQVNRPPREAGWQSFSTSKIAWKTGTSFGFRDAWAVGTSPTHVVAVWAGNADGEGRPGLTGVTAAAPILFDIFRYLPTNTWFETPHDELTEIVVCKKSGYKASTVCDKVDTILAPYRGIDTEACPFHQLVHTDLSGMHRVTSECVSVNEMRHQAWFVLPPIQELYYKSKNADYRKLPPYKVGCKPTEDEKNIELIYPQQNVEIYVPVELDGTLGETVFEAAHHDPNAIIFWHLDDEFVGETKHIHQLGLQPQAGAHTIKLLDEKGNSKTVRFRVVSKRD